MIIELGQNTVAVDTEADLRSVVGTGNNYNYVYLNADIVLTSGITIDPDKSSLTIDGEYGGTRHSFTDMNSTDPANTIGIRWWSAIQITFRNINLRGRNYYGIPYITYTVSNPDLSVTYDRVNYEGPQMSYNLTGLTRYIDCDIRIYQSSDTEAQEAGEANRLELGGRIRISHESTNAMRAVFWFHNSGASLTVLPDADVEITSVNNYFMYSTDGLLTRYPVSYTIQQGARFVLSTNRGISYSNTHRVSSFTVGANASFRYTQRSVNGTSATLYLDGAFSVGEGTNVYMEANLDGAQPLINFTTDGTGAITVNNPKSFVLYNRSNAVCAFSNTRSFTLTGGQLNYWNPATPMEQDAGTFSDLPDHKWNRADWGTFSVWGNAASGGTTGINSDFTPEEIAALDALTFLQLQTARVLSVGNLTLLITPVTDTGGIVGGRTEPNANVRVEYSIEGAVRTFNVTADENGLFTAETFEDIPIGTVVAVSVNTPFLIITKSTAVIAEGELYIFSAPVIIAMRPRPILRDPYILLPREDPLDPVVVRDDRPEEAEWELYASIHEPLQTEFGDILPDAVVFRDGGGNVTALSNTPLLVYRGGPGVPTTNVFWSETEGILVHPTAPIRCDTPYVTEIQWDLQIVE